MTTGHGEPARPARGLAKGPKRVTAQRGAARVAELPARAAEAKAIGDSVRVLVNDYFDRLDGEVDGELYNLILREVEQPMLGAVLERTRRNQSRAAKVLGLSRGTLRKKLKLHDFLGTSRGKDDFREDDSREP